MMYAFVCLTEKTFYLNLRTRFATLRERFHHLCTQADKLIAHRITQTLFKQLAPAGHRIPEGTNEKQQLEQNNVCLSLEHS